MSAITDYIGIVYSGEGYVQGIMPQGVSDGGDDGGGDDGEEPDLSGKLKEALSLYGDWSDEIGAWFAAAYKQSQVEGASRALVPIPPALPPALIGAIIGLPAAPVLIPVTIGIALISKIAQGWLSYRNVVQFQEFLTAFRKAFLESNPTTYDSIPAKIATNIQSLTAQQKEMTDALESLDDKFEVTINGEAVSLTNLIQKKTTATDSGGTEYNILERILRALEALQYNNEIIDLGGVRVALRSKLITEP